VKLAVTAGLCGAEDGLVAPLILRAYGGGFSGCRMASHALLLVLVQERLGELARTERRPQCSRRPRVTSGHVGDTAVQQGAAEELGHAPTRSVEGSPLRRRQAVFTRT
jgi:hypothetical protein